MEERQLVVFRLHNEEFGVEITDVREIVKPRHITRLPHVADYIEGVTNLRGEVIPVICLRKRFGLEPQEETQDTRIIMLEINNGLVGFIVDAVTETLRLPEEAIEPPPSNIAGLRADYLAGVGKVDDRLLILLDVDKILSTDEKIQLQSLQDQEVEEAQEQLK
ncbi:MAG: chemotaxis protein CheW [Limnochordia bacterium]|jgi:purine-binding chemotaxis protein CheW|nr:chemotaxis protein CheW [Limnochordia bacterium]MDI9464372.1 chemotaxis protein CheW [Bacillota bacterium]NLO94571.1 purine-binding chemotaxis protein CheW [Bacillota bacterium]HAN95403.1 chemotaxis protein CheW [Bacillota bacterium]HOB39834.1 chemotaxis protein CheW [Limnochordia bacterium]